MAERKPDTQYYITNRDLLQRLLKPAEKIASVDGIVDNEAKPKRLSPKARQLLGQVYQENGDIAGSLEGEALAKLSPTLYAKIKQRDRSRSSWISYLSRRNYLSAADVNQTDGSIKWNQVLEKDYFKSNQHLEDPDLLNELQNYRLSSRNQLRRQPIVASNETNQETYTPIVTEPVQRPEVVEIPRSGILRGITRRLAYSVRAVGTVALVAAGMAGVNADKDSMNFLTSADVLSADSVSATKAPSIDCKELTSHLFDQWCRSTVTPKPSYTPVFTPTQVPKKTYTATQVIPTETKTTVASPTPTYEKKVTKTPTHVLTATAMPSKSPVVTETSTVIPTETITSTAVPLKSPAATETVTVVPTKTATLTATATPTRTVPSTPSGPSAPPETPTFTPTPTEIVTPPPTATTEKIIPTPRPQEKPPALPHAGEFADPKAGVFFGLSLIGVGKFIRRRLKIK